MDVLFYAFRVFGVAAAMSVAALGMGYFAMRLHKRELQEARREGHRTRYVSPREAEMVRCTSGGHTMSRRRAINDGFTYDGSELFICHRHLFERKRQLREGGAA